jgi:hypothetical protein
VRTALAGPTPPGRHAHGKLSAGGAEHELVRDDHGHLANIGDADRNRAGARIARTIADPAELAGYRARLAERNPSDADLTDDEISARLNSLLESEPFGPTTPESAVDRWAALDNWDKNVATFLPDEAFDEWSRRSIFAAGFELGNRPSSYLYSSEVQH